MDGLYEIVPGSVPVEMGGKLWRLGPLRLCDHAELERRCLARRRPPLDVAREAVKDLSDEQAKHILGLAFEQECRGLRATPDEIAAFAQSYEGMLYELWLRLRQNHPEMTLESTEALCRGRIEGLVKLNGDVARRTGEEPLGNLTSPERPGTAAQSPGAAFSGSSSNGESHLEKSAN